MNRATRVKAVFAELQQAVGHIAPASELLRAAAGLVELSDPTDQRAVNVAVQTGGLPFEQWGIDRAMADGGWRVMSLESALIQPLYEDERDAVSDDLEVKYWLMEHAA